VCAVCGGRSAGVGKDLTLDVSWYHESRLIMCSRSIWCWRCSCHGCARSIVDGQDGHGGRPSKCRCPHLKMTVRPRLKRIGKLPTYC